MALLLNGLMRIFAQELSLLSETMPNFFKRSWPLKMAFGLLPISCFTHHQFFLLSISLSVGRHAAFFIYWF